MILPLLLEPARAARACVLPGAALCAVLTAATAMAAPGDLDPSFAAAGLALTTFDYGLDTARAADVQADGKLVIAGYTEFPTNEIVVVRYRTDGSLDPAFGNGGEVRTVVPGYAGGAQAFALKVQPDGKIVVGGHADGTSRDFVVVRYQANGALDPTLDGDGIATVDFGDNDQCTGLALQADGSIVAAGTSGFLFAVARLSPGGNPDASFSGDGKVTTAVGTGAGRGVAIQSDGRIVVVGSGGGRFRVARYNTNGTLDTTFDVDGLVNTLIAGATSCEANAVAIQPAIGGDPERIVVVGRAVVGAGRFAVARYNLNGSLDATFDGDGMLTTNVGVVDNSANAVLVQGTVITVAGYSHNGAFRNMAAVRYTGSGSLDSSFDGDGMLALFDMHLDDEVHAVALQGGKPVLVGYGWPAADNRDFRILRREIGGAPDSTFDGDGLRTEDIGDLQVTVDDAVIQPDGKVLVAGYVTGTVSPTWALARYGADGTLDPSFGSGGRVVVVAGSRARALAVQPDGRIVVAGTYMFGGDFLLGRFLADGSLDPSFGGNDVVVTPIGPGWDEAHAIALQPDGRILVAGWSHNGANNDIVLVRYLPDGSLDTSFSGDGIATATVGTGDEYGYDVEVLGDGKILVCGTAAVGASQDIALVRFLANGSIDNAFGSFGRVATDVGSGSDDYGLAMAVQPDGRIVVGGASGSPGYDFAVLRYTAAGALDASFDGDGKVLTPFGLGDDFGQAVALQPDGRILVAGYAFLGANVDMAVARYDANGALDAGYGFGGRIAVDFDGGQDVASALCVDALGRAVVAGTSVGRCGVARLEGDGAAVGVATMSPGPPEGSRIGGVAPNPASGAQSLVLHVAPGEPLRALAIYTVAGRRVWSRDVSRLAPGTHRLEWDGRSPGGGAVAPGIYFARLEGARASRAVRVVRIR